MAVLYKEKDNQLSVNSLLSPPEQKRSDSFSSPRSVVISQAPSANYYTAPITSLYHLSANGSSKPVLLSPPISPATVHQDKVSRDDEDTRDPPLFSSQDTTNGVPLFPQPFQSHYTQQVIEDHCATTPAQISEDEYALVAEVLSNIKFQSSAFELYQRDPTGWYDKSLATLKFYDNIKAKARAVEQQSKKTRRTIHRPLAPALDGGIRRKVVVPQVKRTKQKRVAPPQPEGGSYSIIVQKPAPKPPKVATTRENDTDFASVPDYSPPIDTLNGQPRGLRSDWKGTPLQISKEPHFELLHEQEANLASTLRLTPAQYLTSKRRIFEARVNCFHVPKEFRKTDAQQACNIDVNKASKLHSAFEKVGWFQEKWFTKYM